jgi:hypothetical protein
MSELKAVKGKAIYDDIEFYALGYGQKDGDAEFNRLLSTEYYPKADVDKILAVPHTDNSAVIAKLLDERRWRKFSEEKPKENQWILVFVENPSKYGTYMELRRWDMVLKFDVENQELYTLWMPQPSAPEEDK